jgi:hypothetical protein
MSQAPITSDTLNSENQQGKFRSDVPLADQLLTSDGIKVETLRQAYIQIKNIGADDHQIETNAKMLETILEILNLPINANKKKNLLEMIKTTLSLVGMTRILDKKLLLVEKLIKTIFSLPEAEGLMLMKNFDSSICHAQASFSEEFKHCIVEHYYREVGLFIDQLVEHLKSPVNRFTAPPPAGSGLALKDSLSMYEEMFSHIKAVGDKSLFPMADIGALIEKYFQLLVSLRLEELKKSFLEGNFVYLLHLVSRMLNFFSFIASNKKDGHMHESRFFKTATAVLDKHPERIRQLFGQCLDFLTHVPMNPKLKNDAFGNFKYFSDRHPHLIVENLRRILQDEFFVNRSKVKLTEIEINKIYYFWISAEKMLIRSHREQLMGLDLEVVFYLIENNINIFFEDDIHPNYLLNIMHNVGSLCEVVKDRVLKELGAQTTSPDQFSLYAKYLFMLIKKLVRYQKKSCRSIAELVEYLKAHPRTNERGRFEEFVYQPKEEAMEHLEQFGERVLEEEVIVKGTFSAKYSPEVLIQHSFNVQSERSYKFESFIEDSILKKMMLLNEIIFKYFVEYLRLVAIQEGEARVAKDPGPPNAPPVYALKFLRFQERDVLQKIFLQNLQIFSLLICNVRHFDYPKVYEHFRFPILNFFIFKQCYPVAETQNGQSVLSCRHLRVKVKEIYSIFQNIGPRILLTFIDIYQSSPENYTNNYTLFIDTFSGSASIDSQAKGEEEMVKTARTTLYAFNEVVILKVIEIMQKKRVEFFDALASRVRPEEVKTFAVRILKGIYRKIKYRDQPHSKVTMTDLTDIKDATLKLILVIMEKTYTEPNVMNYLQLLRSIFSMVYKIPEINAFLTDEATRSGIKIYGYLFSLFNSNYHELRIMAVELLMFCPFDPRRVFKLETKKLPELRRLFDMLEMAMDLNDNNLPLNALHLLDHATAYVDAFDLRPVFNERIASIFGRLKGIISSQENQFSILKRSATFYTQNAHFVTRLLGKVGDWLQDARELSTFEVRKAIPALEEFELRVFDEAAGAPVAVLDLKEYIEVLYQELGRLKARPWFNNFYSISINYIFFCTVKHKRGLERLFDFLHKALCQLDHMVLAPDSADGMRVEAAAEDSQFFDKTFECLYNVVFLMHPFKIAGTTNANSELRVFEAYIEESVRGNPKRALKFMELIMRNVMLNLELASEKIDTTIFNFVRGFVERVLFRPDPVAGAHARFVDQLIGLLTNRCVYGINAALHLFRELVLGRWGQNADFTREVKARRMALLRALILANAQVDKKFRLRLNAMVLDCFRDFLDLFVQERRPEGELIVAEDLDEFFKNVKNFEDPDVFEIVAELSRRDATPYKKFFKDFKKTLTRQMNTYMKTLRVGSEDRSSIWNFEFLQVIKSLLTKLVFAFEQGKYRNAVDGMNDQAKTVLMFIKQIREEITLFDKRERDAKSSTLLPPTPENQNWTNNPNLYYTNFDLKIHVDKYDYIIKEFCAIFEKCTEVVSRFFSDNRFEGREMQNPEALDAEVRRVRKDYMDQKEAIIGHMMELGLRCEKSIIRSILRIVPHSIQPVPREENRDKDPLQQFKILLKMFQKNEIKEHNLYMISKLVKNYPKLVNNEGWAN